jgi:hypothetical protein
LERIKKSGDIFWAQSDRDWILDGASVRVSMIGFDGEIEKERLLDNRKVSFINADLSSHANVANRATPLPENAGLCFLGMMKAGPFDIDAVTAKQMLSASNNPNGRSNSDVIRHRLGGQDIVKAPRNGWIIDFNDLRLEQAAQYSIAL